MLPFGRESVSVAATPVVGRCSECSGDDGTRGHGTLQPLVEGGHEACLRVRHESHQPSRVAGSV